MNHLLTWSLARVDVDPLRDHAPRYRYVLAAYHRDGTAFRDHRRALHLIGRALGTSYLDWHAAGLCDYLTASGRLELYVDFPVEFPSCFVELT